MYTCGPALFAQAAGGGGSDPSSASVVLLAHFDGTNGSTTLTNEVSGGPAISGVATDACISTAQSVFGGASLRVQNSSMATCATSTAFNYGTGDFTIEFRFRVDSIGSQQMLFDNRANSLNGPYPTIYIESNNAIHYVHSNALQISSSASAIAANTWYAVAVSRVSGTTRMFLNGTQIGSDLADSINYVTTAMRIGQSSFSTLYCTGYWDELRVTKGVGRYASNYTIAAASFPYP